MYYNPYNSKLNNVFFFSIMTEDFGEMSAKFDVLADFRWDQQKARNKHLTETRVLLQLKKKMGGAF